MTSAFDSRIVKVGIEVEGEVTYFENLDIRARGTIFMDALPAQCDVRISNLTKEQRNYILTKSSPLLMRGKGQTAITRKPTRVILEVGRQSYGSFILFEGGTFASLATQPPDIGIVLQSLAGNEQLALQLGFSFSKQEKISVISANIAKKFECKLVFEATDRYVANYSFTGDLWANLEKLNKLGGIQCCYDSAAKEILVIDANAARKGEPIKINLSTGMVGVPQVTSEGVYVKMLIDRDIRVGSSVEIESLINPAANGKFKVINIGFDVANRDTPFFYTLFCSALYYFEGTN